MQALTCELRLKQACMIPVIRFCIQDIDFVFAVRPGKRMLAKRYVKSIRLKAPDLRMCYCETDADDIDGQLFISRIATQTTGLASVFPELNYLVFMLTDRSLHCGATATFYKHNKGGES